MTFQSQVLQLVSQIPKGKVTTYKLLGNKLNSKAYRAIGQALKNNPNPVTVPCHRVIASDLSLGGYCGKMNNPKKIKLLKDEGITFENNKISPIKLHMF
jgi:methylated-DNA-[protein]-cysteine S-methyltransferase|tara:strand:+ start:86 stop:382 length:297 start_codon:yes stop_codon:yes gene_type:complete